jgi:hypothetical protein
MTNGSDGKAWTIQTGRAESGVSIITMEDAFGASGGDTPFLVKVDIEGFERDLFTSNLDWIEHTHAIFVEPHDWMFPGQRTSGALQDAMAGRPYELHICGDNLLYVRCDGAD